MSYSCGQTKTTNSLTYSLGPVGIIKSLKTVGIGNLGIEKIFPSEPISQKQRFVRKINVGTVQKKMLEISKKVIFG
jgi:hypothetical protein